MATVLLDTHAVLWWLAGDRRLPDSCRQLIEDPKNLILVSAASAWEVSIKMAVGKLSAPDDLLDAVADSGLEWIGIEPAEAYAAGALPLHHRDPFDRLLVAQAHARSASLLSRDEGLDRYSVRRIWG